MNEEQDAIRQELVHHYGWWNNHPDYDFEDWRKEVANGETRYGYWDWVASKIMGF